MVTHRYQHPAIELCRTCNGEGKTINYEMWDVLHQYGEVKICNTCEGSGRVLVSKKIEVTVVPFENKI